MVKAIVGLGCVWALSGCSGHLYTYPDPADACDKTDGNKVCERYAGVLYRPLIKHEREYLRDRILNSKGEITHYLSWEEGKRCTAVQVSETVLIPHPDNEQVIAYEPAFFETSKFNVDLNANGTLSKVGAESTPGGKALVESAASLAVTGKLLSHGETQTMAGLEIAEGEGVAPACTHGALPLN